MFDLNDLFDERLPAVVDPNRWLIIARAVAARGSRMHLTGVGDDEMLGGSATHVHALL